MSRNKICCDHTCLICDKLVKYNKLKYIIKKIRAIILFSVILLGFLVYGGKAMAKIDLSIAETDITFSKDAPLNGDTIKVYARAFNSGDSDVSGYIIFLNEGKEMADPQPVSLKPNTYDDVFINWKVRAGTYNIVAKIIGLNPKDDQVENNETVKKDFFVDLDTDGDAIGDAKDNDTDGDELTNEEEKNKGTNPLVSDTDGDNVNDKIDTFPLDKTEIRDTDGDAIGDNKDDDADGDELPNIDEIQKYGTNPLNSDSDNDGLNDKQEVQAGANPNNSDTDGDGVADATDKFPIDKNRAGASLMDSVAGLINSKNSIYLMFGIPGALLVLFFLFRRKKEGKRR